MQLFIMIPCFNRLLKSSHIRKKNFCYFLKLVTLKSRAITALFKVSPYSSFGDAIVL